MTSEKFVVLSEKSLESIKKVLKEEAKEELIDETDEKVQKIQKEARVERFFWVSGMTLLFNVILLFGFNQSGISGFHMTWVFTMELVLLSGLGRWLGVPYVSDVMEKILFELISGLQKKR